MHFLKRTLMLAVIALLIASCGPRTGDDKTGDQKNDSIKEVSPLAYDTLLDDRTALIAGMAHTSLKCMKGYDTTRAWRGYAADMDTLFMHADDERLVKMQEWAGIELSDRDKETPVFYPFSGPDFLSAHCMYPNAKEYTLIGLEPVGKVPELCEMESSYLTSSLNAMKAAMGELLRLSFFRTASMRVDMNNEMVTGTTPILMLFVKRTGHHIVSIKHIVVDTLGKWQYADKVKNAGALTPGVRIEFVDPGDTATQAVMYFSTNISDEGLKANAGFTKFLAQMQPSFTYLKAASYLMHRDAFSSMRSVIFDHSKSILQDDSGIAFRFIDQKKWSVRLFGDYTVPIKLFLCYTEDDLAQAYKDSTDRPLPFNIGYKVKTQTVNMLYAVKKGVLTFPKPVVKK